MFGKTANKERAVCLKYDKLSECYDRTSLV